MVRQRNCDKGILKSGLASVDRVVRPSDVQGSSLRVRLTLNANFSKHEIKEKGGHLAHLRVLPAISDGIGRVHHPKGFGASGLHVYKQSNCHFVNLSHHKAKDKIFVSSRIMLGCRTYLDK